MIPIFLYNLSRSKGQILGWGIGLALLAAYLTVFYDTLVDQQEALQFLLEGYPPEMWAFFGGIEDLFSVAGYLNAYFYSYMPLIIGIFAVLAGSGLLVADEENGTLDLVMSYPVSRSEVFYGRLGAYLVTTLAILLIIWLGYILVVPSTMMDVTPVQLALPLLSLFGLLVFFAGLALLLSFILPSRRMAAMVTGLALVVSYFITSWANIDESLQRAADFSPISYMQGGFALDGLNWGWFLGLFGIGLGFCLLAWLLFLKRDIRVGGESGWRLPAWRGRVTGPVNDRL